MRKSSVRIKQMGFKAVIAIAVWTLASPVFASASAQEREFPLKGTTNTRDIGGYVTSDERTLRWRQIIRSENLSRLKEDDFKKLENIGLKTVIDLRTQKEHDQGPTVWKGDNPPQFFHFPVGDAKSPWFRAQSRMMKSRFTQEQSLEHMVEGYRIIAEEGQSSYQQLMEVVLDESNWPLLIHCNAGKDRAGIAVALIMEALGVDRETIMDEYLLTNELARTQEKAVIMSKKPRKTKIGSNRSSRGSSASAWLPIVGVHSDMLEAFYESVDEQYGSMDVFLTELGVDQDARIALTESLTTAPPALVMGE